MIAGCVDIEKDVQASNDSLRGHLQSVFRELLENDQFIQSLPGHVSDGAVTMQRVQTVIERIKKIAD